MPPIHLACASDVRYLPHLATLIESLAASNPVGDLRLHLLHDESLGETELNLVCGRAAELGLAIEPLRPAAEITDSLGWIGHWSPLVWYRSFLPDLLPQLDRVLYLDADMLVLQDLRALWAFPLGDDLLAAVPQHATMGATDLTALGVPRSDYFNSGVLLMNLELMRAEKLPAQLIALRSEHGARFTYADQDAYNIACHGRWRRLHPKWNGFASMMLPGVELDLAREGVEIQEALASPAVLHFEGSPLCKPWFARCLHPHRNLYLEYRKRTPWPLHGLEGAGLLAGLLRRLPIRQQLAITRSKRAMQGLLGSLLPRSARP